MFEQSLTQALVGGANTEILPPLTHVFNARLQVATSVKAESPAERMLSHVPLARPASVAEISHAVLMLVAPEASYFNGATVVCDGGWTCGFSRDF